MWKQGRLAPEELSNYGKYAWEISPDRTITTEQLRQEIRGDLLEQYEDGNLDLDLEKTFDSAGAKTKAEAVDLFLSQMDTADIVDTAGAFDSREFMQWLTDNYGEALADVGIVTTSGGMVTFGHAALARRRGQTDARLQIDKGSLTGGGKDGEAATSYSSRPLEDSGEVGPVYAASPTTHGTLQLPVGHKFVLEPDKSSQAIRELWDYGHRNRNHAPSKGQADPGIVYRIIGDAEAQQYQEKGLGDVDGWYLAVTASTPKVCEDNRR
jgi:hypothetical protein